MGCFQHKLMLVSNQYLELKKHFPREMCIYHCILACNIGCISFFLALVIMRTSAMDDHVTTGKLETMFKIPS